MLTFKSQPAPAGEQQRRRMALRGKRTCHNTSPHRRYPRPVLHRPPWPNRSCAVRIPYTCTEVEEPPLPLQALLLALMPVHTFARAAETRERRIRRTRRHSVTG
ncbi:hypothetical protein SKAU_G00215250 [Synaphobranchus kaupii]|uniref:Uncharacterized protein n=1 Tax=Synaphobranchus kaupii TaxID=118154 RepID=A0A9Q1IVG2_SYNKA|nr:hypothetical protein SKAU_G00215190 [Synaphobranchus kaupii]KAJ8353958.1 hypothetical protein SKAU_G00215250 [Synaphobranchus kaupii]